MRIYIYIFIHNSLYIFFDSQCFARYILGIPIFFELFILHVCQHVETMDEHTGSHTVSMCTRFFRVLRVLLDDHLRNRFWLLESIQFHITCVPGV